LHAATRNVLFLFLSSIAAGRKWEALSEAGAEVYR